MTRQCRYGILSFIASDTGIGRSLRLYGEWAQGEIDFLSLLVATGSVVFDVGANVGTHTVAFARHVGSTGLVYAFEPQATIFRLLQANVEQNALPNVKLFNVGLADKPGEMAVPRLDYSQANSFGSIALSAVDGGEPVAVETIDRYQPDGCDLIKIDVEGMEQSVIAGAQATIGRFRPLLFIESWDVAAGWVSVSYLRELGYEAFFCRFPGFNPSNYLGNEENIFTGITHEPSLLFVPTERLPRVGESVAKARLLAVHSLDDMVKGMSGQMGPE